MPEPLFIIPARGGSKGIPRKNIKAMCGRPLIAYSIDVALALAKDLDHIILSTDSEEIAECGRACGLRVDYMRPTPLATDTASSQSVIIDAMDWAEARGIAFDCVVLLQPTSPLRTVEDVERTIAAYTTDIDMAVTVTEAASNPYYNCFETTEEGFLRVSKGEGLYTRRQDAPAAYEFNGAVYAINPSSLRAMPMGAFPRRVPVAMPRSRSVDLDTPLDWLVAEAVMREQLSSSINC